MDMELDFAIQHCKEAADRMRADDPCSLCAKEHEQLARWLEELQAYRALGSIDHLRELVQAEKDGRLVVLQEGVTVADTEERCQQRDVHNATDDMFVEATALPRGWT